MNRTIKSQIINSLLLLVLVSQGAWAQTPNPLVLPKIDRKPAPIERNRGKMNALPACSAESDKQWQVDLRAFDLSDLNLSKSANDLMHADFDSRTIWPAADKMPQHFDRQQIMELGKNPGLGIRQLHAQQIDGRGVGIAIIDSTLLVDHQEYAKQLRLYEEAPCIQGDWLRPGMHGPAVASLAVGKTVGVAPGADLYYIASALCTKGPEKNDFACLAHSVRRILEVNRTLPQDRKIRVISMSVGWQPRDKGYREITAATKEAVGAGMLVICSGVEQVHGFDFAGLGRAPMADPDQCDSYEPGAFWSKEFYSGPRPSDQLLVPMDSRTTASLCGLDEYVFYREGGFSWSIPYIAGVYALAAQVKPTVTPNEFWKFALQTGRTVEIQHREKKDTKVRLGPILDPIALISRLQR